MIVTYVYISSKGKFRGIWRSKWSSEIIFHNHVNFTARKNPVFAFIMRFVYSIGFPEKVLGEPINLAYFGPSRRLSSDSCSKMQSSVPTTRRQSNMIWTEDSRILIPVPKWSQSRKPECKISESDFDPLSDSWIIAFFRVDQRVSESSRASSSSLVVTAVSRRKSRSWWQNSINFDYVSLHGSFYNSSEVLPFFGLSTEVIKIALCLEPSSNWNFYDGFQLLNVGRAKKFQILPIAGAFYWVAILDHLSILSNALNVILNAWYRIASLQCFNRRKLLS